MSNTVGVLIALAILAHAVVDTLQPERRAPGVGRYALIPGVEIVVAPNAGQFVYRIDSVTGEAWHAMVGPQGPEKITKATNWFAFPGEYAE